jgi:hypothetical protein
MPWSLSVSRSDIFVINSEWKEKKKKLKKNIYIYHSSNNPYRLALDSLGPLIAHAVFPTTL